MRTTQSALCLVLVWGLGCGGGASTTPATETPPPAHAAREPAPPPKPWKDMSKEERAAHMNDLVLPVMEAMFRAHDAKAFEEFKCSTCHGMDGAARGFEMPSNDLPALASTGSPEQKQMVADHPEMVKFMFNRVLPGMRTMVGGEEFDAETGEGFSCFSCHRRALNASTPAPLDSTDEPTPGHT